VLWDVVAVHRDEAEFLVEHVAWTLESATSTLKGVEEAKRP
jgi:hypothetical protein